MPRRGPGMAGQRWEKKRTDVRAGAQGQPPASPLSGSASQPRGLGPELFHAPSLNVPASLPSSPDWESTLDVQVCMWPAGGDKRLWEALPHSRPQLSGDFCSPQSSYFGPIPNTSSWFMAGEPEARRLTIKGENRTDSGSLLLSLPSRARLLWDPVRERGRGEGGAAKLTSRRPARNEGHSLHCVRKVTPYLLPHRRADARVPDPRRTSVLGLNHGPWTDDS